MNQGQYREAPQTYPCFFRDDGLGYDLEVVHVEDVLEWWSGFPCGLPRLLLISDLLDDLCDCARVDDTKATQLSASEDRKATVHVLLLNGQVGRDSIWWVDGVVRLAVQYLSST